MRLNINTLYTIHTTSGYVSNKHVKVLGYIGYDRASQYQSLVENIAINEKFINTTADPEEGTIGYLKTQIFYDCEEYENVNGQWNSTGKHYIFWDDIIDFEKTQKINEKYTYKLEIEFKALEATDNITIDAVLARIKQAIASTYNTSSEKVGLSLVQIHDNSLESIHSQYEETTQLLEQSKEALNSLVSLEDAANIINENFEANNVNAKINNIGSQLDSINSTLGSIISKLK